MFLAFGLAAALAVTAVSAALAQAPSSYSGRATVLSATAPIIGTVAFGDTGALPSSGGKLTSSAAAIKLPGLGTAGVGSATTQGQGQHSKSSASLTNLDLTPLGIPITATVLESDAQASCQSGTPQTSAGAQVVGLVVNGTPIVASTPNLTINVLGLATVVVNEQTSSTSGRNGQITVNALHISVPVLGIDVVVAHSEADITCT
jgi:hypothetical protein